LELGDDLAGSLFAGVLDAIEVSEKLGVVMVQEVAEQVDLATLMLGTDLDGGQDENVVATASSQGGVLGGNGIMIGYGESEQP
jgi:hypothetical protein